MNHHVNNKYWVPYTTMMRFMFYDEVSVISDSEGDDIINGIGEDDGEPVCLDLPSEVWAKVLDCEYKMIHSSSYQ